MSEEVREFAQQLADQTETHEQWLAVVRFGIGTLVRNPEVLAELLIGEANKEFNRQPGTSSVRTAPHVHLKRIMDELGLKFVLA